MGSPVVLGELDLEKLEMVTDKNVSPFGDYPEILKASPNVLFIYFKDFCGTAEIDGRTVGAYGLLQQRDGVFEVWTIITPELRSRPLSLFRLARKLIYHWQGKKGIRRLEANVLCSYEAGQDFAERLGFVPEGVRMSFTGPGIHSIFYGRVAE